MTSIGTKLRESARILEQPIYPSRREQYDEAVRRMREAADVLDRLQDPDRDIEEIAGTPESWPAEDRRASLLAELAQTLRAVLAVPITVEASRVTLGELEGLSSVVCRALDVLDRAEEALRP